MRSPPVRSGGMIWLRIVPTLLVTLALPLLGCSPSPEPVAPPVETPADAGTDAGAGAAWDGSAVALEEKGNWPEDPGPFAPCKVVDVAGAHCDARNFDLSACDTESLAQVPDEGLYMMTLRQPQDDPEVPLFMDADILRLPGDGGTPVLSYKPATVEHVGRARVFSVTLRERADGGSNRVAAAQCQA